MKPRFTLRNAAAWFVTLASIMISGLMSVSHAQTGQPGVSMSVQGSLIVAQLSQRWGDAATGQKDLPPESAGAASTPGTPDRLNSSSNGASVDQAPGAGSCRYATPEQESFFCKMRRIFYGRDSSGPNRDMDSNISAGGAGG
ncbi:hypothetical protein [Nitrosospira sp. NpAV]|uniref:hypothetical protein n=1 Tax=Nitrosospira sp. NpAV TaxID=58133 RepID=UPI0005A0CF69|nr:hypothetical protein [Nitrosospira sp. NpAV]KIO50410.1 hypothetical protein SQ11_01710 [Nitrosospira sp. NpAV]